MGYYLKFSDFQEEGEEMMRQVFDPKSERLAALKQKYNPTNFFRLNLNIWDVPHHNIEFDKKKIYGSMVAWLAGKRLGGMTRPLRGGNMTEELYREFKHDPLYEKIALHIESLVSSGKLQPGNRLPSERELAEGWGVGRGVVREAVKLLAERGLVTISPGRGTFVSGLDTKFHSEQLGRLFRRGGHSYGDLHEVRQILEVEIAGLAAQKASPADLEKMRQAIEEMDATVSLSTQVEFIKADTAFHAVLAEATHNSVFPLLMDMLMDLLEEARFLMSQTPGVPARSQAHHKLIFESVERGDAAAARQAMWQHTQQVAEDMEATVSAHSTEGNQMSLNQSVAGQ